MPQELRRHPDSTCIAATRIEVDVARPCADSLVLSYMVYGKISELCLPPVTAPARGHELWQRTFYRVAFRKKVYRPIDELQAIDLQYPGLQHLQVKKSGVRWQPKFRCGRPTPRIDY